jgi:ATP-dependent DNA ligase
MPKKLPHTSRSKKEHVPMDPGLWRPMEARQVAALPREAGWQYEPKWDGFRCIGIKNRTEVILTSKSGKPLRRYFPEIEHLLAAAKHRSFVVDGELCVPNGPSLSFEALQMRLHPAASRIAKLSKETPAVFILFDLLAIDEKDLRESPLIKRRERLERLFVSLGSNNTFRLSPRTHSVAQANVWLSRAGAGAVDGVIAKRLEEPYRSGERAMLKVKRVRTADCVVGGFRYGTNQQQVASLLLGLFDADGKLDHVGFTSGISAESRLALTKKLEKLRGGEGFSGSAPGGPSRWATERSAAWVPVRNKLVAEVQFDQVSGGRFRHGTRFLRWRPDKAPRQCTIDQLLPNSRLLQRATELLPGGQLSEQFEGGPAQVVSSQR